MVKLNKVDFGKEINKSINSMSIVYIDQNSEIVVTKFNKQTREVLKEDFTPVKLTPSIIESVNLFDVFMFLDSLNFYTEADKINYMSLGLLSVMYVEHKETGKLFESISLQNRESTYIEFVILIPVIKRMCKNE